MLILDTDLLTLIHQQKGEPYERLRIRLRAAAPTNTVAVTIIIYEEQMRGWLAVCAGAKTIEKQVEAYKRLHELLRFFQERQILDFEDRAAQKFQELRKARVRIGTMDLKIAAIALANDAILLSRNLKDFHKVPGLQVEDWTKTEA